MNVSTTDYIYSSIAFNTRVLSHLRKLSKFVYNWYMFVPFALTGRAVTFRLRDGTTKTVKNHTDYLELIHHNMSERLKGVEYGRNCVSALYKGRRIYLYYEDTGTKNKAQLLLLQNFIGDNNKSFAVRGKTVVDIGSAIADTPMLFVLNGARHVYGYEPDPQLHRLAGKNLSANHLEGRITLLKKPVKHLKDLERHGAEVLKIDCEGCEYNLIMGASNEVLNSYSDILLEYHYGYKDLVAKLKGAGFKISKTMPIRSYDLETSRPLWLGTIYATKHNARALRFQ